ncbi:uncharacterized protein MCYG_02436 [Microsporum canis CBS 113480]|uniref:Uncharacterized protein n=1 Tax=Arthroderma otae (strain ATCC MYA-4605 / CBS 113480) TaxID=554155 RepID=C5FFT2_ARTOC|nr:uncharacterized protein MCYG_02436 [Microsporum canis CBS 113480]EEQ29617.1 predicted protein [Microsporum canis CBS 113480]
MVVTESLQPILQRQKNPTVFNVSLLTLINNKRAFTKGRACLIDLLALSNKRQISPRLSHGFITRMLQEYINPAPCCLENVNNLIAILCARFMPEVPAFAKYHPGSD